jgi:uncharacterized protein YprB with RNaseH-like and TPR domain
MKLIVNIRQGFGFDIEYNDDICHIVEDADNGDNFIVAFNGAIIKLPFLKIYWGEFEEVTEDLLEQL